VADLRAAALDKGLGYALVVPVPDATGSAVRFPSLAVLLAQYF
jgi:hypothetical protein